MRSRVPIVLFVVAALVVGIFVQRSDDGGDLATTTFVDLPRLLPVVQRAGVASSTFYCAGGTGTANPDSFAEHVVNLANASGDRRVARVTVYRNDGDPVTRDVPVEARSRADLKLSDVVKADYLSAVVEVPGGEVAVAHTVSGPTGRAVGTCASSPSNEWYLPAGSTRPGARLVLAVFNPFPDDAVVDIAFDTDDGNRQPTAFTPLLVPGGRVLGVDVTPVVTLRNEIATTVRARAGSGRVVVDQLQSFDGRVLDEPTAGAAPRRDNGLKGMEVALGAPSGASTWAFGEGTPLSPGVDVTYWVMNPGTEPAEVEVQVHPDVAPGAPSAGPVEPYEVTVRAGEYAVVSLSQDGRVPVGAGHWATVTSLSGPPIVAARVATAVDTPEQRNQPQKGFTFVLGSPVLAQRWIVAAADADDVAGAVVTVVNPSPTQPAQLTVSALHEGRSEPVPQFDRVELAPGARTIVGVDPLKVGAKLAIAVDASAPVVVEQRIAYRNVIDVTGALGEPVVGTLSLPSDQITTPTVPPDLEGIPTGSGPLGSGSLGTAPPGTDPSGTGGTTGPGTTGR